MIMAGWIFWAAENSFIDIRIERLPKAILYRWLEGKEELFES